MGDQSDPPGATGPETFERQARERPPGLVREFWDFLRENKKWWLLPILVVLLLVAGLIVLAASPAAPLIYTLF